MDTGKRKRKRISRREFIDLGIKSSAGIGLTQLGRPVLAFAGTTGELKTVPGACYHDCPDCCSWMVTAQDGKITKFEASTSNPFTAGKLCDKMDHFPDDVTFHPDRILTPLKRVGKKGEGTFEAISWKQAMDEISSRLKSIVSEKGGESVLPFSYAGTEGLIQHDCMSRRFFARVGATQLTRTICGDAAGAGVAIVNGDTTGVMPEDIVHSRYIVLWGVNPVVTNQHLWPFILKARQNGAKIVVIDSFQSDTALQSDWHIQPKPGTDVVLALGMIHVILSEALQDKDYISRYTLGIEELTEHAGKYTPEMVANITGVDPDAIRKLSREYAKASPSLIRILIGLEKHANGANSCRAIAMLPALTGAWRHQGGGLMHFTYELFGKALNWERLDLGDSMDTKKTRSINMVQIGRALNDRSMAPQIHALIVYNSNPAVIAPDQNQVMKGLAREDLMTVVLEHFVTDTARYADYVLPATTQLEHWDLMISWGQNYINLNQPAIAPRGESKPNSEIFRMLARAMGFEESCFNESDLEIIKKSLESKHPYMKGITFDSLMASGWARLGLPAPWIPHARGNFTTESGKCEFYSGSLKDRPLPDYRPVTYAEEERKKYPLELLSIKSPRNFLNTSHANVRHLLQKEGTPYADMHEVDAKQRGIRDGDTVKVFNQRGQVMLTARIKNKVRAGVVCIPQGFWASLMKGGSSANALTNDLLTDMGEGSALQETIADVVKA